MKTLFQWLKSRSGEPVNEPASVWTAAGVVIAFKHALADDSVDSLLESTTHASASDTYLKALLSQLVDEGCCTLTREELVLPWKLIYELKNSNDYSAIIEALRLPVDREIKPVLNSVGTLSDPTFKVIIDGWIDQDVEVKPQQTVGPIFTINGEPVLLHSKAWHTLAYIQEQPLGIHRSQHENEIFWGNLRVLADSAGALYRTPYLQSTYVLTPKNLRLLRRKNNTRFGAVLTVEPTFSDAPENWLKTFDAYQEVQDHYDMTPPGGGRVRVVISDPVHKVLSVIKREMPGRHVAGSKAEKFLHNPWAFLGDAAEEVLNEAEFVADQSVEDAAATIFTVRAKHIDSRIENVFLLITQHFGDGGQSSHSVSFRTPFDLQKFSQALESALRAEAMRFAWDEYDLTIDGDAANQLEKAQQLLHLWLHQLDEQISFEDVYGLSGYSERIEGIGEAKAIYVPLLMKPTSKEEDDASGGWVPENLIPMVKVILSGHEGQVVIPLTQEWVAELELQVAAAERADERQVSNDALPTPVEVGQARTLVDSFKSMLEAGEQVKPEGSSPLREKRKRGDTLLVKLNFSAVDYLEQRAESLALPIGTEPRLPTCLRPIIKLRPHQMEGIAWFQHLMSKAPFECRGALLADDMGLGKTLQLLTVLGTLYEDHPDGSPSLILAPKSLIHNWASETKKFFTESFANVLVLYGEELKKLKQPLGLIDAQLKERGITDLLRPNWSTGAKVIITTYEVLSSFEFSIAKVPFSVVICDEAQRIKTPGTRAAKAVRALITKFRVACTGTPVENSLADLWTLFDWVQPGLLGDLEAFGKTYRKPIECETDEQKEAVKILQKSISPQTLRRTKAEMKGEFTLKLFAQGDLLTGDLTFKEHLEDNERLVVPMTQHQHILYLAGLKKLQDASKAVGAMRRARASFGALHLMKAVCAEPYCVPGTRFLEDKGGRKIHLHNSSKLDALLNQLARIRDAKEKAIVFTELKEVQAGLFYFIKEIFGIRAYIINGDSENRQTYIDRFSDVEGFNVIILSTLAAGAGLNVTAANHVFHFTRAWNPAKEAQATDRAFRIGQTKNVYVYCPVTVNPDYDTFDVKLDKILRRKESLARMTLDGSSIGAMLNGTGADISMRDLFTSDPDGQALESRAITLDDIDRMDGLSFEVFCALLWRKHGFITELTSKPGGDGGIDVVAIRGQEGELLQCKSSSRADIGWDAVKEVTAGAAKYERRFQGTKFRKVAVTNRNFNTNAHEQADLNQVTLIERETLADMLSSYIITNLEFDSELIETVPFNDI